MGVTDMPVLDSITDALRHMDARDERLLMDGVSCRHCHRPAYWTDERRVESYCPCGKSWVRPT